MNHALAFAEASVPAPWCVFGVKLKPFSIGHRVLLDLTQSPLVNGGVVLDADVLIALRICSRTYERGIESLNHLTAMERVWQWRFVAFCAFNKEKARSELGFFRKYINDATHYKPPVWCKSGTVDNNPTLPDTILLVSALLSKFYLTDSDVMNMPYKRAVMLYYAKLYTDGAVQFRDPKHEAMFQEIKEKQKVIRNELSRFPNTN